MQNVNICEQIQTVSTGQREEPDVTYFMQVRDRAIKREREREREILHSQLVNQPDLT